MGKIDLNKPIITYLPEYKGQGAEVVTIHQLLTHTSGIKNCEEIGVDTEILRMPNSLDNIINKYCSGNLVYQPGTRFSYNNADYIILGRIIEEIYHKSFEQVLTEKILQPLKMENSGMIDDSIIENLANAYIWNRKTNKYNNNPSFIIANYFASGAMYSTTNDLLKFSNILYKGGLLYDKTLEILLQTSSASQQWAHGLEILIFEIENKKLKSAYREGGCQGTKTSVNYIFDKELTIIILSNAYKDFSYELRVLNKTIAEIIMN